MSKSNGSIADALGIENHVEIIPPKKAPEVIEPEPVSDDSDQTEDYKLSRRTFRDLINKGNGAIEDLTDLARQSESPRAYEVLATLMKTVSDATKDLYDLQKKTKELKKFDEKGKPAADGNITVEKAVFVGSPSELLAKIKEAKNEDA